MKGVWENIVANIRLTSHTIESYIRTRRTRTNGTRSVLSSAFCFEIGPAGAMESLKAYHFHILLTVFFMVLSSGTGGNKRVSR